MDFIIGILTGISLMLSFAFYLQARERKRAATREIINLTNKWCEMAASLNNNTFKPQYPTFPKSADNSLTYTEQLFRALEKEDYEQAAKLRDIINKI